MLVRWYSVGAQGKGWGNWQGNWCIEGSHGQSLLFYIVHSILYCLFFVLFCLFFVLFCLFYSSCSLSSFLYIHLGHVEGLVVVVWWGKVQGSTGTQGFAYQDWCPSSRTSCSSIFSQSCCWSASICSRLNQTQGIILIHYQVIVFYMYYIIYIYIYILWFTIVTN